MLTTAGYPRGEAGFSRPSRRCVTMSSRTGNLMIGLGAVALVMGLIALPAALGEHVDTSLLTLGACGVSLGSMIAATGVYLRSRAMLAAGGSAGRAWEIQNNRHDASAAAATFATAICQSFIARCIKSIFVLIVWPSITISAPAPISPALAVQLRKRPRQWPRRRASSSSGLEPT